jgi:proline dehydrogenase
VVPTMKRLEQTRVGSILDLAMEADVDDVIASDPHQAKKQAIAMREMMQSSIDIAAHQPDSFIAVKITAFVPPPILVRWTECLNQLPTSMTESEFIKWMTPLVGQEAHSLWKE